MTRLEPRAATLLAILYIGAVGLVKVGQWQAFGALWLGLAFLAGRSLGRLSWRGLAVTPFTLAALPLLFSVPGPTWFLLGPFKATHEGFYAVATILLRAYLAVQASLLLLDRVGAPALLASLRGLGVPSLLVGVIAMLTRYASVLQEESERMQRARRNRSAGHRPPPWDWRARTVGMMAGNLFLRSLDRGERVHQAMCCRGFDGKPHLAQPARSWGVREACALGLGSILLWASLS